MGTVRWVRNKDAWKDVNNAPGLVSLVEGTAATIAGKAGAGYETRPSEHTRKHGVARQAVVTATGAAIRDQARNNTLQKAMVR